MNVLLNQDELVQKLLNKISQQASELSELNFELEKSSHATSMNSNIMEKKNEAHSSKLMSSISNRNTNSNSNNSETKINQVSKRSGLSNAQFKNTSKDNALKKYSSKSISYIDVDATMNNVMNIRENNNSKVPTKSKTEANKSIEILDVNKQNSYDMNNFNQHILASDSSIFHEVNAKKMTAINGSQKDHDQIQLQSILNPIECHDKDKSKEGSTTLQHDNRVPVVQPEALPPPLLPPPSSLPFRHSHTKSINGMDAIVFATEQNYSYPDQVNHSLTVEEQREALQHHIQTNISKEKIPNPLTELLNQANSRINNMEKEKLDLLTNLSLAQQSVDNEVARNKELEKTITRFQREYDETRQRMTRDLQMSRGSEEQLRKECLVLRKDLESKTVELEEIASMQSALLLQMQSKETSYAAINDELQTSLRKLQRLEFSFAQQETEKINLINQMNALQSELQQLHATYSKNLRASSTSSPAAAHRQKALEQELHSLHNSLADLRIESASKSDEIRGLTSQLSALSDMNREIVHITNEMTSLDASVSSPHPQRRQSSPAQTAVTSPSESIHYFDDNISLLTISTSLLPWIRKVSEPLAAYITTLNDKIKVQSDHAASAEKSLTSLRREIEVERQRLGGDLARASQREALASRLLTEQRQRLDAVEPEIAKGREARAMVTKIVETLQSAFMEIGNSSKSSSTSEAKDVTLKATDLLTGQVTITDQNVDLLLKELLVEHQNNLLQIQQYHNDTSNTSRQQQRLSEELRHRSKENDLLHAELLAAKRAVAETSESFSQKDNRRRNELAAAVELSERQNALIVTMEAKIDSLRQDRKLQQAQVLSHLHREDICKERLRTLLQDFVANQSPPNTGNRSPFSIPPQIDEQKSFAELINYLAEALSYVTQVVSSDGFSKKVSPQESQSSEKARRRKTGAGSGIGSGSGDVEHDDAFDHDAYEKFRNEYHSSTTTTTIAVKKENIGSGSGDSDYPQHNKNINNKRIGTSSRQKYVGEEKDLGIHDKREYENQLLGGGGGAGRDPLLPPADSPVAGAEAEAEAGFPQTSPPPEAAVGATGGVATPMSTQYLSAALSNSWLRSPSVAATATATTTNHREETPTRSAPLRKRTTPSTASPPFAAAIPKLMQQRLKHAKSTLASLRR